MTAEEIYQRWYDDDANEDVLGVIRLAMVQARKAALEEAAIEAVRLNDWGGYADAPNIARRIRSLVERPQAVKSEQP